MLLQNQASRSSIYIYMIVAKLEVLLTQFVIAWCASNPNVSSGTTEGTKESQGIHASHFLLQA